MKRYQYKKFMEKKVKRSSTSEKSVSDLEEKLITITILIAIAILTGLLIHLVLTPATQEPFAAIYLLDSEKQTANFPKTVVLGENSTFSLWVGVENHNGEIETFSVYIKIDDGNGDVDPSLVEPTESFDKTLLDKGIWELQVTITIDQLGSNRIIFELWFFDETKNDFEYSGNWVSLSIEAI